MNIARALIEIGVILLAMVLSIGAVIALGVWMLWAVFGPPDDM